MIDGGVRWAFYGRVSTEDNQDPTLSPPRQLANCEVAAASVGGQVVTHFYDIESGAARYEKRGAGHVSDFDIQIPREGGLLDLLQEAGTGALTSSSANRSAAWPGTPRSRSASRRSSERPT